MMLVQEGYRENAGQWTGKAERQWEQRTTEGRHTKKGMERKGEPRVRLLKFSKAEGQPISLDLLLPKANDI